MSNTTGQKGYTAEEAVRHYFQKAGFFVVRGVPFFFRGLEITDVDLWLYARTSPLTCERTCVDMKNRRTPRVLERILWTRGLKELLGVDRAIVSTTDIRPETREFGLVHGIRVIQGGALHKIIDELDSSSRLSEEEFFSLLGKQSVVDPRISWREWLRRMKSRLLSQLTFDGYNSYVLASRFLLEEYLATSKASESAVRLLYVIISYMLICLDYLSCSLVFLDDSDRLALLTDGFRFGEYGRRKTENVVKMAHQLLSASGGADLLSEAMLSEQIDKQMAEYPAEIMAEHFSKARSLLELMAAAAMFEEMAYSRNLVLPHQCQSEAKVVIGLLCDVHRMDRKDVI